MANAAKDQNGVSSLTCVLNTDGETVVRVETDPVSHGLMVNNGTTGADNGPSNALHDENDIPTLLAVSSADGKTPVTVYADASGAIFINSM